MFAVEFTVTLPDSIDLPPWAWVVTAVLGWHVAVAVVVQLFGIGRASGLQWAYWLSASGLLLALAGWLLVTFLSVGVVPFRPRRVVQDEVSREFAFFVGGCLSLVAAVVPSLLVLTLHYPKMMR